MSTDTIDQGDGPDVASNFLTTRSQLPGAQQIVDNTRNVIDFHFDVDPDLDLAIGTELAMDEAEDEFEMEDFTALGIDPLSPTGAKPGSEEKVRVLAARYAAGVPLWNDADCSDHGPVDAVVGPDQSLEPDEFPGEDDDF